MIYDHRDDGNDFEVVIQIGTSGIQNLEFKIKN